MPRAGAPLFVRLFFVMLASVVTVQMLNFALISYVGLPFPHVYAVRQIVGVLRTGTDPDGNITVSQSASNPLAVDPRADQIRRAIATQLGLPLERVAVSLSIPLQGAVDLPFFGRDRPQRSQPANLDNMIVVGDFIASAKLADGRWRIVQSGVREVSAMHYRAAVLLIVAMLTVAPFAWGVSRRAARPIALFAAAAERLGRDPRAKPMAIRGPTEIEEAATAFNLMQARLNRYVEDRLLLIAAMAHDLRTPLMRLSLRLEQAPAALRAASEADIADMQAMIGSATAFVRDMTEAVERRPLDLRSLIETVTDSLADLGQPVGFQDGAPLIVNGQATSLKTVVANLVGNAIKYGNEASVRLTREGDVAIIDVSDTGPGIPETDLDRVFEPFFRGEWSRNRDTGGSGLGLASVRAVVHAHGGRVTIANLSPRGLLVRVSLPV